MRATGRHRVQQLTELYHRLEADGPTPELELTWIDLRKLIELEAGTTLAEELRIWHHVGYMILDRRKHAGNALHYLKQSLEEPGDRVYDLVQNRQTIFLYAAFVADDKFEAISALRDILAAKPDMSRKQLVNLKMLVVEYLQLHSDDSISQTMEGLMRRLFGIIERQDSDAYVTGEALISVLDPRGHIGKKLIYRVSSDGPPFGRTSLEG